MREGKKKNEVPPSYVIQMKCVVHRIFTKSNETKRLIPLKRALFIIILGIGYALSLPKAEAQNGVIPRSYDRNATRQDNDTLKLEEALISVPYGRVKKNTFVGSAAAIKPKDMQPRVATSFVNKLDGAIPGVNIGFTGRPGTTASMSIRGTSSINSGSAPLIILNGMQYGGSLASINPEDIENVEVLKDASATALYGSRGANGVILITTKQGSKQQNTFHVEVKLGFGTNLRYIREYDRVSPGQYYQIMWESIRNNAIAQDLQKGKLTNSKLDSAGQVASRNVIRVLGGKGYNLYNVPDSLVILPDGTLNPNAQLIYTPELWSNAILQTKLRQEHTVAISGNANGKTQYYVSLNYLDDPGIIFNSSYNRYSFNTDITSRLNRFLKIGANAQFRYTTAGNALSGSRTDKDDPFNAARSLPSIYPVYVHNPITGEIITDPTTGKPIYDFGVGTIDPTANRYYTNQQIPRELQNGVQLARATFTNSNAIGTNLLDKRNSQTNQFSGRFFAEFNLADGLVFRSNFGVDFLSDENIINENLLLGEVAGLGRTTRSFSRNTNLNISNVLSYVKEVGRGFSVNTILGHEFFQVNTLSLSGSRQGFLVPNLIELDNGATILSASSSVDNYRLQGVFLKLGGDYENRYFAEVSVRRDQSSVFRPGNQFGIFYSIGGGWDIAREQFWDGARNVVNQFKIKASYGITGNDGSQRGGTAYYGWQTLFEPGHNNLNAPGILRERVGISNIHWESLVKSNAGIELGFLRNRLLLTIDGYYNPVNDMLYSRNIDPSTGISSITENIGAMYNAGIEWSITGDVIRAKKQRGFNMNLGLNGFWQYNEITRLPEEYKGKGLIQGTQKLIEGGSLYSLYIRKYMGVDTIGRPLFLMKTGDKNEKGELIRLKDANGNPIYDKDHDQALQNQRNTTTIDYNQASRYYTRSTLPIMVGAFHGTFSFKGFELYVLFKYSIGGLVFDGDYGGLLNSQASAGAQEHKDIIKKKAQLIKEGDKVSVVTNGYPMLGSLGRYATTSSDRFLVDGSYLVFKNISLTYSLPQSVVSIMHLTDFSMFLSVENVVSFSHLQKGGNPESSILGAGYPMLRGINGGIRLRL